MPYVARYPQGAEAKWGIIVSWGILKYVYLIRSKSNPRKTYIGITEDFRRRLKEHNEGRSRHTSKWPPWEMVACIAFAADSKAEEFESYLKVGSGHAFARKHLW